LGMQQREGRAVSERTIRTGYFARASGDRYSEVVSGVHLVDGDDKPLCRYSPALSMEFLWCSNGVDPMGYLSCKACKGIAKNMQADTAGRGK